MYHTCMLYGMMNAEGERLIGLETLKAQRAHEYMYNYLQSNLRRNFFLVLSFLHNPSFHYFFHVALLLFHRCLFSPFVGKTWRVKIGSKSDIFG